MTTKLKAANLNATYSADEYLKTSAAGALSWGAVDALPSQTSQSGKFLTTDGSSASWATVAGGLSYAQQWRLTADLSCSNVDTYLYANWEKPESEDSPGVIGTDMSVNTASSGDLSGAWTFPATGVWYVSFRCVGLANSSTHTFTTKIWTTDDTGSTWYDAAMNFITNPHNQYHIAFVDYIVSISNVSTHKVRFSGVVSANATVIQSDTDTNETAVTFIKLGD